jgi:fructose-bisphosphate aldolase / 2-amino-3,7-dideoxy-D-threo-hept-6-ulosonate synthase
MAKPRGPGPLSKIIAPDGKTLIVAMDHGGFMGAASGWENPEPVIRAVLDGGADAVMTTFGIIKKFGGLVRGRAGLIFSSPLVGPEMAHSAAVAKSIGADCVKIFVGVGMDDESANMNALWSSSLACHAARIPLLAEMFPFKGTKIQNPIDKEVVKKYSRFAAEYGADMVKTFYTGSEESFREVASSCLVPVVILGGDKTDTDLDLLKVVEASIKAGGSGVAIGRNIWQHKNPKSITRAISKVIHEGYSAEEAALEV